ncbi:phage tail protein [Belliella pelovolcani]|uniref:Microcystin-dependent protein n=1 Tax=Belliella pelovolcani TaxID=529505 RepID=A0A1N7PNT8_9BACT|nr:tail fiber protein [Belliella pelovolcani]SIT12251.1 Microcystin-dependent protein [Belliella pelovolcani]
MEPFIGQIMMFAGNFAPRGWAFCEGQLLPISSYSALFSILGTTYGGDGRTTFALPDLRGRGPIHFGAGPGLSPVSIGQSGGTEQVTLSTANIPPHNHTINVSNQPATSLNPDGNFPAAAQFQIDRQSPMVNVNAYGGSPNATLSAAAVNQAGSGIPFNNRNPYLAISYVIALEGIFPSRP